MCVWNAWDWFKKKVKLGYNRENEEELPQWKPMPFNETFRESLLGMDLNQHAKKVILMRYVELVLDTKHKHINVLRSYNILRVTTLLSGLVTPVFFSITNDVPNSAALFWVTLVTSLAGSISNAWLEFFSITKLHYTYLYTSECLEAEGWYFASLTGPYRKYSAHHECWQKFVLNTERIHSDGVNRYMINSQPQNRVQSGKELIKETGVWKRDTNSDKKDDLSESSIERKMKMPVKNKNLRRRIALLARQYTDDESNENSSDSSEKGHEYNQNSSTMCTININE